MKFTLAWLKDHIDTTESLDVLVERLSMLGLEVEGVENPALALAAITVAHVVEAHPHPNADRLRVCDVDTGSGRVQVVCGAPNARSGMKAAFAPPGTTLPGTGLLLKKSVIRGEESNGMLCSMRELGLGDEHDGIIDLPTDAPVGAGFAETIGLHDPVIDIAITPNRADCLGVRGVARDLAAAGLGRLKPIDTAPVPGTFESPLGWRVDLPAGEERLVPLVLGRCFRGVRNGPSPAWMQERLRAIGLRPISALVDVTNYVMFDLGRPLHAYDADKVDGDLVIRLARPGERYLALNGKEYAFDPDMLVIGDRHGPDDLAGIMGGEKTGCTDQTTSMFLEIAIFDPVRIAATGRRLNVTSDARYRFERGLDPEAPFWAMEVATRLILELCGGEASDVVIHDRRPDWRRAIPFRLSRLATLGGRALPDETARTILDRLGFAVDGDGEAMTVSPPSWRADIEGEADIVEEILRVDGYDAIEAVSLSRAGAVPPPSLDPRQRRTALARRLLASRGLIEAVTYSFMARSDAEHFGGVPDSLALVNPISAELDVMRPSIVPNLVRAASRNAARGMADVALFEIGPQYADDTAAGQALVATVLRAGAAVSRHWQGPPRPVDAFDAKADALSLLEGLDAPAGNVQVTADAPSWYHPGRSGTLRLGPAVLGWFGELHPAVAEALDAAAPLAVCEVFLDRLPLPKSKGPARPLLRLSPLMPVTRDFAFVVGTDVPADKVLRAVRGADKALIADVTVFDVYDGDAVGPDQRSIAVAVTLQPRTATLAEADIEAVSAKIRAAVEKQTGGTLRA